MSVLKIIPMEDPRLRAISKPVEVIDQNVRDLVQDLTETMMLNSAVGLAAPQVGENISLFVINLEASKNTPTVFINPSYESIDGSVQISSEGCLSVGEIGARITRLDSIRVSYTNLDGDDVEMNIKGRLSACIQHECDHLEGILFIDYLSKEKLFKIIRSIK